VEHDEVVVQIALPELLEHVLRKYRMSGGSLWVRGEFFLEVVHRFDLKSGLDGLR